MDPSIRFWLVLGTFVPHGWCNDVSCDGHRRGLHLGVDAFL